MPESQPNRANFSSRNAYEKAVNLSYPAEPDGRGHARIAWNRRSYYFGKHNSAESFLKFGRWRAELLETGKPPELKQIRMDLEEELMSEPTPQPKIAAPTKWITWKRCSAFAALCSAFAALIFSIRPAPGVDGLPLSEAETEFIRGFRKQASHRASIANVKRADVGEITAKLLEQGPSIENKPHKNRRRDFVAARHP